MNFGATAGDYYAQANDNILVVLQTESPRGVENAEAIYALPGCDAIFIGPNDLRFQMRKPDGTVRTIVNAATVAPRLGVSTTSPSAASSRKLWATVL